MTDTDDATTDDSIERDEQTPDADTIGESTIREYVLKGALALLVLLAVVATIQLYLSVSNVIGTWVEPRFRALFRAAFNLVVLLLAVLGISWLVRALTE
jgi:uncharacterized membrane protein